MQEGTKEGTKEVVGTLGTVLEFLETLEKPSKDSKKRVPNPPFQTRAPMTPAFPAAERFPPGFPARSGSDFVKGTPQGEKGGCVSEARVFPTSTQSAWIPAPAVAVEGGGVLCLHRLLLLEVVG